MTDQPRPDVPAKGPIPQQPSSPSSAESLQCSECGALVGARDVCWLCGAAIVVSAEAVDPTGNSPFVPDWEKKRRASASQFSLESLMLVITLIAVCLGMLVAVPGLGVLVCIVAVPALVRALIAGRQHKAVSGSLNLQEKVLAFLASTGIVLGILLAGLSAFAVACVGTCFAALGIAEASGSGAAENWIFPLALGSAVVVALAVVGWLFWLTLPRTPAGGPPHSR
jgi:hypothetical protein